MSNFDFEDAYQAACESGLLPGVVLLASGKNDDFQYVKTFGVRTLEPGHSSKPIEPDTVLALASCTKLITSIAALQCVERGLFYLDVDVSPLLPEIGKFGIITGFDDAIGQPITVPNTKPVTVRNLLAHTSGYQYDMSSPLLHKWRASRGETPYAGQTVEEKATLPMIFEPNTNWAYGPGVDWVGKLIERVTGETLETYMSKNIWGPLGIRDMTFWPKEREDMKHRIAALSVWDPAGGHKAIYSSMQDVTMGATDCLGGGGIFGSCEAYMKLLNAVLKEDSKLLRPQSYEELFKPQLNEQCAAALQNLILTSEIDQSINVPASGQKNFALGGLLSMDEYKGWMKKNTMLWGGLPNIIWFIDRETGLCGLAACQMLPPMAPAIMNLHAQFQREIYQIYQTSCV